MPKIQASDLTPEHHAALKAYALRNGRFWKRKLLLAWSTGRDAEVTQRTAPAGDPQPVRPVAPAGPQPFPHRLTQKTKDNPYACHHRPLCVPGPPSFRRSPARHGHRRAHPAATDHHREPPRNHRRRRSLRPRNSEANPGASFEVSVTVTSGRKPRGFDAADHATSFGGRGFLPIGCRRFRPSSAPPSIPSPPDPRSGASRQCPRSQCPGST